MGVSKTPGNPTIDPKYSSRALISRTSTKRTPRFIEQAMYFLQGSALSLPYVNPKPFCRSPAIPFKGPPKFMETAISESISISISILIITYIYIILFKEALFRDPWTIPDQTGFEAAARAHSSPRIWISRWRAFETICLKMRLRNQSPHSLGLHVYRSYLLWDLKSTSKTCFGLFGAPRIL